MRFLRPAFLALCFFTPAIAAAQVSLTLGSTTIEAGSSGSVSATLANDGTAVALQFDVVYDPALLSISSVAAGSALTPSHSLTSNSIGLDRQRIVITTSPVNPLLSGTLATVTLAANAAAAAAVTPLTFEGVVISDATAISIVPAALSNGSVTITTAALPPLPPTPPPIPPAAPPTPVPAVPFMGLVLLSLSILLLTSWKGGRAMRASKLAILVLCVLPWSDGALAQSIPGDANGDGRIDAADVLLIVERILERGVLPGDGDCNRDTVINVLDTICAQQSFVPGETDPIILGPGDRSIPADVAFQMNLFAADPDTGSTLSWQLLSGPAGLSVNTAGVLNWTPAAANLGNNPVSVRVTDNTARTADASFAIAVFALPPESPANAAPTLMVPANQTILVGVPLALQATAMDPDAGDTLTYSLVDAPADMSIDPATGAISWPAQANPLATADVVVSVADAAGETAFGRFTVRADAANGAPTARDDVYVARKGETLTIAASEGVIQNDRDPNGDTLSASSLSDPTLGTLDSFNADGSFSYTTIAPTPITIGLVEKCTTTALTIAGTTSVADMDGDGDVEMAGIVTNGNVARVFIADPSDCSHEFFPLADGLGQPNFFALTTLVNLDDDPELELVAPYSRFSDFIPDASIPGADERLMAVNIDGTPVAAWGPGGLSEALDFEGRFSTFQDLAGPVAADLDGDGDPELIIGFNNAEPLGAGSTSSNAVIVYDGRTGTILWEFRGGITRPENRGISPVLVDLDLDGDTEIIWNQFVLDHTGALLFELPVERPLAGGGNTFLTTAIANFDTDAFPEILAYDRSNLYLFTHSGAIIWQRPFISNGSYSDLTIAELDGDPFPEFVAMLGTTVPTGNVNLTPATLYAFDSDGEDLWDNIADEFLVRSSTATRTSTPVAFDLDQDGIDELIQVRVATAATASGLYIINGETGETIDFQVSPTSNSYDQALTVADVDDDGSAEIITSPAINFGQQSLQVWDNLPGNPFPPARSIRTQHNVQPTWVNAEGTPLSEIKPHWLQPGRNGWNMIQPDVDPLAPEQDSFTYRVNDGEFNSNTATVNIEVRPAGNPPFFISEPDTATSRGALYEYRVLTVDVDPGDVVSYALVNGPPGMSIDADSGVLSWYADANGEYPVSIIASDQVGRSTAQIYRLAVGDPVVVPDVVGSSEAAAGTTLDNANLFTGDVFRRIHPTLAAGTVYEQNPIAGSAAAFGAAVDLFVSSGPGPLNTDDDGDTYTENQGDCNDADANIRPGAPDADGDGIDQDCDGIDGNKVLVSIELTPASKRVLTNSPVPLTAMGIFDDGTAQNLTAIATWTRGPTFFEANSGNFTAQASFSGVTGSAVINVVDRVIEDLAPVARIDSPGSRTTVSAPTEILGEVSDNNMLRWELAYQRDEQGDFVLFAEGSSNLGSVGNPFVLGEFDPTTVTNGVYNIRLRVYDRGGNVSEDGTTVEVDGYLKPGNYDLQFIDLDVPVAGLPIQIVRGYSTIDKESKDFGVGWRLGVDSLRLTRNRPIGEAWRVVRSGLTFALLEDDAHTVAITLTDGRVESFDAVASPNASPIVPFPVLTQSVRFVARPGTYGTLEALGDNTVSILESQPGPATLSEGLTGNLYDPLRYRYTAVNGTQVVISRVNGVESIADRNGNSLTIDAAGITHSSGRSVSFERDGSGRIARITDPDGNSQSYAYSAAGDLSGHTDPRGNTTRYEYDADHNLLRVFDAAGRSILENIYDAAGRIISTTDSEGRELTFVRDLDVGQERLIDADGAETVYDYDERGNLTSMVDALGNATTYAYDANDNLVRETDPLGAVTTRTFDGNGNLLSTTDPLGNTTAYVVDVFGNVTLETDPRGAATRLGYDANGNLSRVELPDGSVRTYTHSPSGNVVAFTDERGEVLQFEYNGRGDQVARVDARGARVESEIDLSGRLVGEVDRRGNRTSVTVDAMGARTEEVDPLGNAQRFSYGVTGRLEVVGDALGNERRQVTDGLGRVLAITDREGGELRFDFDLRGKLRSLTQPRGGETRSSYDEIGRRIRTVFPDGSESRFGYDADGRLITSTDRRGSVTTFEYDAADRQTAVVDALGQRVEMAYDANGNMTSETDALGNVTRYSYDSRNRRTRIELPDLRRFEFTYTARDELATETDPLGQRTTYSYDPNGNLLSVVDAAGAETRYGYDAEDNLTEQRDANGNITRYEYDLNNRKVRAIYPDGSAEGTEYDPVGRVSARIRADGTRISFSHDGEGRVQNRSVAGETASYSWDPSGSLLTAANLGSTATYERDLQGRVLAMVFADGRRVDYVRDAAGNVLERSIVPLAGMAPSITRYTYDALGRVASTTTPDGNITSYTYTVVGTLAQINHGNGVVSAFTYDATRRTTSIRLSEGSVLFEQYDYDYDAADNIIRVTRLDGSRTDYDYDPLRRLLQETHRNSSGAVTLDRGYSYDAVGNRTAVTDATVLEAYTYDNADKLLSRGSVRFSYDPNGNLLSQIGPGGSRSYRYDGLNRLVRFDGPGGTVRYRYDAEDQRVQREFGGTTVDYLVEPAGLNATGVSQVLAESDPDAGRVLAENTFDVRLLARSTSGAVHYLHRDVSENVRFLSDASGAVTDGYDYDAFGANVAGFGTTQNPYRYAGERFDPVAGLVHLRARDYDPVSGRFMGRDSFAGNLQDPFSRHRYLYARNNPLSFADPTGRFTIASLAVGVSLSQLAMSIVPTVATGVTTIVLLNKFWKAGFNLREAGYLMMVGDPAAFALLPGPVNNAAGDLGYNLFLAGNTLIEVGAFAIDASKKIIDASFAILGASKTLVGAASFAQTGGTSLQTAKELRGVLAAVKSVGKAGKSVSGSMENLGRAVKGESQGPDKETLKSKGQLEADKNKAISKTLLNLVRDVLLKVT